MHGWLKFGTRSRDRRCPAQRGCGRPQAGNIRGYQPTTAGRRGRPYQRREHRYPGSGCWWGQQPARTSWKHYPRRQWSWRHQRWRRPSLTTKIRSRRVSRCSWLGPGYRIGPGCWWCSSPGPWRCQRWPRCSPGMPAGRRTVISEVSGLSSNWGLKALTVGMV